MKNHFNKNSTPKNIHSSNTKKTKKLRIILTILMCFWTLCSFLGAFSFVSNVSSCNTAYADEAVSTGYFQGSNIFFPCTSVKRDDPLKLLTDYTNVVSHKFRINTRTDGKYDLFIEAYSTKQVSNLTFYNQIGTHFGTTLVIMPVDNSITTRPDPYVHYYGGYALNTSSYSRYPNYQTIVVPAVENGFDPLKVEKVTINNQADRYAYPETANSGLRIANYVRYTDSNGKDFVVWVYAYTDTVTSSWKNVLSFENRTYFLTQSLTQDTIYKAGYDDGLAQGREVYTDSGYKEGYKIGYDEGRNYGFNEGKLYAEDFSFLSMFSALMDAPVKAVTGLFNFNILGVNLLSFVTGVFTLIVIVAIIKLFVGGR